MLRKHGQKGAALAFLALLGGCTSLDSRDWTVADSGSGGMFRAAWGGMRRDRPEDSDTIRPPAVLQLAAAIPPTNSNAPIATNECRGAAMNATTEVSATPAVRTSRSPNRSAR